MRRSEKIPEHFMISDLSLDSSKEVQTFHQFRETNNGCTVNLEKKRKAVCEKSVRRNLGVGIMASCLLGQRDIPD